MLISVQPVGYDMPEIADVQSLFDEADFVGGIYEMGYETCKVHTNDYIKRNVCGGLPKHAFLLARMQGGGSDEEEQSSGSNPLREHALLLRITGPANLPIQDELTSARHRNIEERLVDEVRGSEQSHDLDAYTQQELQKTAVETEILGTFYVDETGTLEFGNDAHTIFPSGEYLVHKPHGEVLGKIVSYLAVDDFEKDDLIDIGEVRYASTRLRSDTDASAPVEIDTNDLVGAKTAVFGMTRTGKSNTLKIIAGAVHTSKDDVGQLIFDPSGEYTPNEQDAIALSQIDEDISVFKYAAGEGDDARPLGANFLDVENVQIAHQEAHEHIRRRSQGSGIPQYADGFVNTEIVNPYSDDYEGEFKDWRHDCRNLAAFQAVLIHDPVNLTPSDDWSLTFPVNQDMRTTVEAHTAIEFPKESDDEDDPSYTAGDIRLRGDIIGNLKRGGGRAVIHNPEAFDAFWTAIANHTEEAGFDDDHDIARILEMISTRHTGTGYLSEMDKFHVPSDENSQELIYQRLTDGELVIVDMTRGEEDVVSRLLRRVVESIMEKSVVKFNNMDSNDELPNIQVFLEEAHRYFSEDRFQEGDDSPYVRLAKEGAKYKIGLVYATQEVSIVDDRVLANTANWIVTHLNSESETQQLADYYDFDVFDRTIRRVQDKGFARIRTESNSFTVPTQIHEFDEPWIDDVIGLPDDSTESIQENGGE